MTPEFEDKDYAKDTLGHHWRHSKAIFGSDSRPTKWLEEQARASPKGMDEEVFQHETQVVYVLGRMWMEEQDELKRKAAGEKLETL